MSFRPVVPGVPDIILERTRALKDHGETFWISRRGLLAEKLHYPPDHSELK